MLNMEVHPNHISQAFVQVIKRWEKTSPEIIKGLFRAGEKDGFLLTKPYEERIAVRKKVVPGKRVITEEDIKRAIFHVKNGHAPAQKHLFVDKAPSILYNGD